MQTLPVTAAPPVTSAQAPAQADNPAQVAEPFGNVLARQRASANAQDSKQAASAPAKDANATEAANEPVSELPTVIPDAASTLPADMLAALLPGAASANSTAGDEKADPQAPATDGAGASTLPGDMLAMLMPATAVIANANRAEANAGDIQEAMPDGGKKARSGADVAALLGEARQSGGEKADQGGLGVATQFRASGNARPEAALTSANSGKDNAFAAALEASGKEGARTAQLDIATAQSAMQPVAPAAPDGLLQSGINPVAASANGPAQVTQVVINTPVTHEAWGEEFNQKITWMATQQEQTAELHLNPPNLGPLDVVLNISGDQATALFTSPHAAVREVVEQALPRLRDMLADNGITLGNATVSDQSPRDQPASQAEQRQKGNGGAGGRMDSAIGDIASGTMVAPGRRQLGMVDTFA